MKAQQSYSMLLINFMAAFRKFLAVQNLKFPHQYFQAQKYGNSGQISKMQFFKILVHLQYFLHFNTFDINELFNQLDDGWDFILIKKFIKVYEQITNKIPDLPSINKEYEKQQQKKRLEQEKQRKNKIIRNGFKKLQSYMLENDAIGLFDECDQNFSGKLDPHQFNKLLICTAIKEFNDKEIRKIVLAQIFSYFPKKEISKEQYIKLFKLPKEKIVVKPKFQFFVPPQKVIPFYQPQIKKEQPKQITNKTQREKKLVPPQPTINIKPPENTNKTVNNNLNGGFKKKNVFQQEQKVSPVKQDVKPEVIPSTEIFPRASVYYRNGQPTFEELQYLEELENLIKSKRTYKDFKNPHTHKGQYVQANSFFNGSNYQLFQMAQSVLQREKSRIGLARQIQPKDIIQGEIGDCYFLSSIASLISICPEVVSEKFVFSENPANYFVLKLFLDGEWKYIATDDCFPSSNGKSPCFAKPHGKEIWVMLLQKCWAKCFGDYASIISGSPKQSFIALTGAPTEHLSLKSKQVTKQMIEKKIKDAYEFRYVVTASGSDYLDSLSDNEQERIGLVGSHAYSFLKFVDVDGNHLVKIRNPWGTRVWKGQWSFESKRWTKTLRERLNYNKCPQDGSFYMNMQDFLKFFGSFVICKVNPINIHTSLKMSFNKHKSNYVRMKVTETGRYIVSLYQQNERYMKTKFSNYKYSSGRIIIMKVGKKWEYIGSYQISESYAVSIEVDLEQGCEYIVSGKLQWAFWDSHEGCLTSYGPDKVVFQQTDRSVAPQFKKQVIEGFFKKHRGKTKDYNKTGAIGSYSESLFDIEKGIGYYFITNPHQKKFELTYSLNGTGVKVIKPDRLPFKFEMTQGAKYLKGFFTNSSGFNYQTSENLSYY